MWLKSRNASLSHVMPTMLEYRGFGLVGDQRCRDAKYCIGKLSASPPLLASKMGSPLKELLLPNYLPNGHHSIPPFTD